MKLQFKHQQFQLDAISAVVDIFKGQSKQGAIHYLADPGRTQSEDIILAHDAFRNAPIQLPDQLILEHVRSQQISQNLKPSDKLQVTTVQGRPSYNLTIEMETGTGKTYTYICTIMELNKRYGWLKFIIVVPSVAIREGVLKSFQTMEDHFQLEYGEKPRYFVYDSKQPGKLDEFANTSDIRVMIINSQAFNATGKDARRIRMELESFGWRKPIDVVAATNPIMIIDEPQSVEGAKTKKGLLDFKPLFTLRYSATHKDKYDMIYRLDALDAYNQKLVKKIAVKAIEESSTTGTNGYLYLQDLLPQKNGAPKARIEFEVRGKNGVRRVTKIVEEGFNLYDESDGLEQYRDGWTLSHFDAREGANSIQVGANRTLNVGEVLGQTNESDIRRIQIRETIKSHLEREEALYRKGIKVLSLFFIDEVAKYKQYDESNQMIDGEYARIFEEEYQNLVQHYIKTHQNDNYRSYLERNSEPSKVHAGYFSVDKKQKLVDSKVKRGADSSDDQDAYDLIMKDKERLLSFEEPVRFLFSHSALKEGWDNPNVFQICTLKTSSAETRKRQEIGRGMRLAVNQDGVRQDQELLGSDVHNINKLTVIANESYDDFAKSLQEEMKEVLQDRPTAITKEFFTNRILTNEEGVSKTLSEQDATVLYNSFIKQNYIDDSGQLTENYYEALDNEELLLPGQFSDFVNEVSELTLNELYDAKRYEPENANKADIVMAAEVNEENLSKKEFQHLWNQISQKSMYQVSFDDEELIIKSVDYINDKLHVSKPSYQITEASARTMNNDGLNLRVDANGKRVEDLEEVKITVRYDLVGEIANDTGLKRKTVAAILSKMSPTKFNFFKQNPEEFILKVSKLINDQKASQVIKHIEYQIIKEKYDESLFTANPMIIKADDKYLQSATKGIYNFFKLDSKKEVEFQKELEQFEDVQVYTKLPAAFKISTPLGSYNPDWAIAFREGLVKHIYFVAETKGSLSSLQLKGSEKSKIDCAKQHFKALQKEGILDSNVKYGVVTSYQDLLDKVRS